jgi:hypothetical protein
MAKKLTDAGKKWLARNDPLQTREGKRAAKRKLRRQTKPQPVERGEIRRREQRRRQIVERRVLAKPLLKGTS